jgi:hypothetical protein
MKLIIEKSSWSGWNKDYKPSIETEQFDNLEKILHWETILKTSITHQVGEIKYNGEITSISKAGVEFFSFTIMELGEDYIVIKTNRPMSEGNDGTISLRSNETTFRIEKGKKVKLTTPTTDAGDIYNFELKD